MEIEKMYNLDILRISNRFNKSLIYNSKIWEVTYFNTKGTPKTTTLTVDRFFKALKKYHKSIHGDFTKPLIHTEIESR